ncbi:MAG: type II toxin-antitoxin system VapC family toxin [Planctomycetaceae bacterium]
MVIPDTNVLLYAINSDLEQHDACRAWLEAALSNERPVGFAWNVLLGVVRISTKKGIFPKPLSTSQAMSFVDEWLAQAPSQVIHPSKEHSFHLHRLLNLAGTGGNLVSDAHLGALAIEYNGEVCSCDQDFDRFPGVAWFNPLTIGKSRKRS